MNADIIQKLEKLKNYYGLSSNHLLIMKTLLTKDLTVFDISKKTGIPKNRIYGFVKDLVSKGLVTKVDERPFKLSIKNLNENIYKFLIRRFGELTQTYIKIYELLEEKKKEPHIRYFVGTEDYISEVLDLIKNANSLKIMCSKGRIPYFLYPFNEKIFLKTRTFVAKKRAVFTGIEQSYSLYRKYQEFLKQGKEITYIIDKDSVKNHIKYLKSYLNRTLFKSFVSDLKRKLNSFKLSIILIPDPLYIHIHLTENCVLKNIVSGELNIGVRVDSKSVAKVYHDLYEIYVEKGTDIRKHFKSRKW